MTPGIDPSSASPTTVAEATWPGFAAADLALLRDALEVDIETRADDGAPAHRTTIWVVVDPTDRVLVRTYRGPGSRWYREAVGNPVARLLVGDRAIEVRVSVADDDDRIAACTDGLLRKYEGDPATPGMVRDEVLHTTLELTPAGAG